MSIALVANQHFNKIIQLRVLSQEPIDTVQRCLVLERRIIRFRAFLKLLFDYYYYNSVPVVTCRLSTEKWEVRKNQSAKLAMAILLSRKI